MNKFIAHDDIVSKLSGTQYVYNDNTCRYCTSKSGTVIRANQHRHQYMTVIFIPSLKRFPSGFDYFSTAVFAEILSRSCDGTFTPRNSS